MANLHVGIDFTGDKTFVYVMNKGLILQGEPIAAKSRRKIRAFGDEIANLEDKESFIFVRPFLEGGVIDFNLAKDFIRYLRGRICGGFRLFNSISISAAVPNLATKEQKKETIELLKMLKPRKIRLLEVSLALAVGHGFDISKPRGIMIIYMRPNHTEISVISMGNVILNTFAGIGENGFKLAFVEYMHNKHGLMVEESDATSYLVSVYSSGRLNIKGKNDRTLLTQEVNITKKELQVEAFLRPYDLLIESLASVFLKISPELILDILDTQTLLIGEESIMEGVASAFRDRIGIETSRNNYSLAAIGASLHSR